MKVRAQMDLIIFQPIHPLRDATGGGPYGIDSQAISIHTLHTGCNTNQQQAFVDLIQFQSIRPLRDVTQSTARRGNSVSFQSIHPIRDVTPREFVYAVPERNFNPYIPYGM